MIIINYIGNSNSDTFQCVETVLLWLMFGISKNVCSKSDLSTLVCSRAAKPHMESFGKRCSYKVPKTSTNIKLVTAIDRNGTETKRVQCEYCPKTHINVPVYNLHVNTGIFKTLTVTSVLIRTVTSTKMK